MSYDDMTALIDTMEERRVEALLALFADTELTVPHPPRSGLVMLTVKDSFDTDFHLGEVLVTEACVLFRGCEGYGVTLGESPRKALARAAADAVFRCSQPTEIGERLKSYLQREASLQEEMRAKEAALIAATKVNFDLMPGA